MIALSMELGVATWKRPFLYTKLRKNLGIIVFAMPLIIRGLLYYVTFNIPGLIDKRLALV